VLLESFRRVRFNGVYFTIFRAKDVKDINFLVEIQTNLQKLGWKEKKNQVSPQCVHTWANGTGYTNIYNVLYEPQKY
jgi:hypothetical protein